MADGDDPPPAKRARHHYDLTKTIDVLVGKEPNQQRFTVHHDLLVQRSEFFKAARLSRWTQPGQPTTLVDHDSETFSTYLHCLYFGADAIKDRLSVIAEQHDSTTEPTSNTIESSQASSSDESSQSGVPAGSDVTGDGKDDRSSASNSDGESASDGVQIKQRSAEGTTQNSTKKLTVLVNGEAKEATTTLFVGNLSRATGEETLEQACVQFGEVRGVRIITRSDDGRSRGFGYVEFSSAEGAAKALQTLTGFMLDGRSLRLDFNPPHRGAAHVPNQDQRSEAVQHLTDTASHVTEGTTGGDTIDVNTNQTGQDEVPTIDYNTSYSEEADDVDNARTRVLLKLYVLADKLIDPHTANLVIDELIVLADSYSNLPALLFINIAYQCTPPGSPLRTLFRDWYIHEVDGFFFQQITEQGERFPVDFLQDIILEHARIHAESHDRAIDDVFRTAAVERPTGHYHQKPASTQSNKG